MQASSGVQIDGMLERQSTTDGQTHVGHGSDEHETSREEQHRPASPTSDMAAARWSDTAASTLTEHQPHYSTVDEQGDASTADGQTNVD